MFKWRLFSVFLVIIIASLINGLYYLPKTHKFEKKITKETKKQIIKSGIYLILLDFVFLGYINDILWIIFIFGTITVLYVFSNLTKVFIRKHGNIRFTLFIDFIVGMALTVYMLFKIPDQKVFTVMLSIIGPVYGGFITLIGVVLTMRYNEIKEERKNRYLLRPIIHPTQEKVDDSLSFYLLNLSLEVDGNHISFGNFKVADFNNGFIEKMIIDSKKYIPFGNNALNKNKVYELRAYIENDMKRIENALLYLKDIANNTVIYKIEISGNKIKSIELLEE